MCHKKHDLTENEKKAIINIVNMDEVCILSRVFETLRMVCEKSRIETASQYIQHGNTSCLLHMIAVAYYSDRTAEILRLKRIHRRELIIGALLHDYFLYDWHDGRKERRIHGFTHPDTALKNAGEDFELSDIAADIIKKHMFPLTIIPPKYIESWIVCMVDKVCSLYETFGRNTYSSINYRLKKDYGELYEKLR